MFKKLDFLKRDILIAVIGSKVFDLSQLLKNNDL